MSDRLQLGEIISDLKTDATSLVNNNIALGKAEMKPIVKNAGIGAGMFGGAGVFALYGLGLLFLTGSFALSLASQSLFGLGVLLNLIIGFGAMALILFIIAGILALIGKGRMAKVGPPEQTIDEAKATIAALKDSVQRGKRDVQQISEHPNSPAARRALS